MNFFVQIPSGTSSYGGFYDPFGLNLIVYSGEGGFYSTLDFGEPGFRGKPGMQAVLVGTLDPEAVGAYYVGTFGDDQVTVNVDGEVDLETLGGDDEIDLGFTAGPVNVSAGSGQDKVIVRQVEDAFHFLNVEVVDFSQVDPSGTDEDYDTVRVVGSFDHFDFGGRSDLTATVWEGGRNVTLRDGDGQVLLISTDEMLSEEGFSNFEGVLLFA